MKLAQILATLISLLVLSIVADASEGGNRPPTKGTLETTVEIRLKGVGTGFRASTGSGERIFVGDIVLKAPLSDQTNVDFQLVYAFLRNGIGARGTKRQAFANPYLGISGVLKSDWRMSYRLGLRLPLANDRDWGTLRPLTQLFWISDEIYVPHAVTPSFHVDYHTRMNPLVLLDLSLGLSSLIPTKTEYDEYFTVIYDHRGKQKTPQIPFTVTEVFLDFVISPQYKSRVLKIQPELLGRVSLTDTPRLVQRYRANLLTAIKTELRFWHLRIATDVWIPVSNRWREYQRVSYRFSIAWNSVLK